MSTGDARRRCEQCDGVGRRLASPPWDFGDIMIPDIETCDECGGTGYVNDDDDEWDDEP